MGFEGLEERLAGVRRVIEDRQRDAGLTHPVRIIAVTKTHGVDAVEAARRAGLTSIGENRVQEALAKQAEAPSGMEWHLIGTLQRNKARHAAGRFALIHSIDRLELASELARRMPDGSVQPVLVQVNCSGEAQKGGVEPEGIGGLLDGLHAFPALRVDGLMTMAAFDLPEAEQRRTFERLRRLRDACADRGHVLDELSMGMSDDFAAAVTEGATMIRLGTVLFGERR
ncbi:MAG TPA: YggS family pyridoxal phosphate-dependent enzyme [Gemmatimonadales bacterium]|nr:YggS family pyridoxal phosphate-dependent enzyme [Gemmatimonadales bacterium]